MINWIKVFIKRYWLELLVFGGIAAVLLIDCAPNYTWINTDSDGIHYTYSAEYLYPSHKSSAPLYLLLGRLFLFIPFGTEFWRMALISVFSGIIGSIFIYLIIKEKLKGQKWNRYYGLIGSLIYGGAALPLSQNIIVEAYPLVTALFLVTYYFIIKKRFNWASVFIGASGAIHPIAMMTILPMLIAHKELRSWKNLAISASFIIVYIYIPLTNRAPYMWNQPNETGGMLGFLSDTVSTAGMLSGGLSIYDLPKRILDVSSQLLLCFGIGTIGLITYFWKTRKFGVLKNELFWLFILPIVYYATDLAPQTSVYMQPSIAFGAIIIGLGLNHIVRLKKEVTYATAVVAVTMLAINANYFDIGRTLDKDLSATKFYYQELAKVPDGQILLAQQGWEWACVYKYNKEFNRNIIPVCVGTLPAVSYQKDLINQGIKFEVPDTEVNSDKDFKKVSDSSAMIATSLVRLNENVWTTEATTPETYGSRVLKADQKTVDDFNETARLINGVDNRRLQKISWKPSNPYDIITGSIEVKEWKYILLSNYNCLVFGVLIAISYIPIWIIWQLAIKKKKWQVSNVKDKVKKMV